MRFLHAYLQKGAVISQARATTHKELIIKLYGQIRTKSVKVRYKQNANDRKLVDRFGQDSVR